MELRWETITVCGMLYINAVLMNTVIFAIYIMEDCMKRDEISNVIAYLQKGNMLSYELQDLLNNSEDKNCNGIDVVLNEVHSMDDLRALNDYEYSCAYESEEEVTVKGLNILFHKKLSDGRYVYRDLLVCANGFKFISDEHF